MPNLETPSLCVDWTWHDLLISHDIPKALRVARPGSFYKTPDRPLYGWAWLEVWWSHILYIALEPVGWWKSTLETDGSLAGQYAFDLTLAKTSSPVQSRRCEVEMAIEQKLIIHPGENQNNWMQLLCSSNRSKLYQIMVSQILPHLQVKLIKDD